MKCRLRFLLRSEVTKGLNFILAKTTTTKNPQRPVNASSLNRFPKQQQQQQQFHFQHRKRPLEDVTFGYSIRPRHRRVSALQGFFFPLSARTLPLGAQVSQTSGVSWGSSFKNLFVRAKHADHLTLHTAQVFKRGRPFPCPCADPRVSAFRPPEANQQRGCPLEPGNQGRSRTRKPFQAASGLTSGWLETTN